MLHFALSSRWKLFSSPAVVLLSSLVLFTPSVDGASTEPSLTPEGAATGQSQSSIVVSQLAIFETGKLDGERVEPSTDSDDIGNKALGLTMFDKSFLLADDVPPTPSEGISVIMENIAELEEDYLDKLQGRRSSYGLYATGEYNNDVRNEESNYSAGVKWKLLNDGYFEAVRDDQKKIQQTRLEFMQLRRDMLNRHLEDEMFQLFLFKNRLNVHYYQEKRAALSSLLKKRSLQLEQGYTTKLDVLEVRRQLQDAESTLAFYSERSGGALAAEQMDILNRIDMVELKPLATLVETADSNSYDLKVQDSFIDRVDSFQGWRDDVAFNVSAEYKHEYYGDDRSVIGVMLEVPLTFDSDVVSLEETQKRIYQYQRQAVAYRLQQKIQKLYDSFFFHKQRLLSKQEEIAILIQKTKDANIQEESIIQELDEDPARSLDVLSVQTIDARYEALDIRLKMYEIVVQLSSLTGQ